MGAKSWTPGREGWCWPRRGASRGRLHPPLPQRGGDGDPAAGRCLRPGHHRAAGGGPGAGNIRPRRISEPLRRAYRGRGDFHHAHRGAAGLSGCDFSPLPDRIFASTLACAAAAAGGRVELTGCPPALYAPVLEILEQMGCTVERGADRAEVARFGRLYRAGRVFTGVYPGLATDAAPLLAAAMLCAEGESSIEDVIFERRFGCAEGFERLGGRVKRSGGCSPSARCRKAASTEPPSLRPTCGAARHWWWRLCRHRERASWKRLVISTGAMPVCGKFWPL